MSLQLNFFMFYNLNGVPIENPESDDFWIKSFGNIISLKEGDSTYDIESICLELHDLLVKLIFGNIEKYYSILPSVSEMIFFGGIDSECKISKEQFEKLVSLIDGEEIFNKLLYLYDCRNLISTLQNSVIETKYLFGQFYKILNENSFLLDQKPLNPCGVQFASGFITSNIFSVVNSIFINLYGQLDFITKICFEFENLSNDFSKYPKLKSSNILYGDKKKLSLNNIEGSLFESCENIRIITTLRNEIVHNRSFDNLPKVYQVFEKSNLIEKYILLPDFENGTLKTYKNRRRFFDLDIKLNLILPSIIIDFWTRTHTTLVKLKEAAN